MAVNHPSYKLKKEVKEVKNGANIGKTGLGPGLLANQQEPVSLKMVLHKRHRKEVHLLNFANVNSTNV
jgi:hypothetical protein